MPASPSLCPRAEATRTCGTHCWAILAFEESYRLAVLVFERILFLCQGATGAVLTRAVQRKDAVLQRVCEELPAKVSKLAKLFDRSKTGHLSGGDERIGEVRGFLESAAAACKEPTALVDAVVGRHTDVQHGKLDRGRRKMPWVEAAAGGLALTSTRVGGLSFEATGPEDILPHPYRLGAATALINASGAAV